MIRSNKERVERGLKVARAFYLEASERRRTATVASITESNPIAVNLAPVVRKVSGLIELRLSFLSQ